MKVKRRLRKKQYGPGGYLNRVMSQGTKTRGGIVTKNGKRYWLTPPEMMKALKKEFGITFDACPYPRPKGFDGLTRRWGMSTYVNPPFVRPTAWARKAIAEHKKGKTVVMVFPVDKWIHYLLEAGAEFRSFGDVKWCCTRTKKPGKGIGRYTMGFILRGK
jgi:hypothetical protein